MLMPMHVLMPMLVLVLMPVIAVGVVMHIAVRMRVCVIAVVVRHGCKYRASLRRSSLAPRRGRSQSARPRPAASPTARW